MKRAFVFAIALVAINACGRSPESPVDGLSGNWTLLYGPFSPTSPVFFANLKDSSGSISGTTAWSDGSYALSGTRVSSNVEFTATSVQSPSRVWHFSGVISNNAIIGNANTDSTVVQVTFLKGGILPP